MKRKECSEVSFDNFECYAVQYHYSLYSFISFDPRDDIPKGAGEIFS